MILDREQRASDLATKADRDISPKLTDEQYHALLHYTFKAGFKHPVQLLEAFVGDLSGWHRNEDPEEDYRETYGDIYPYDWYEDYLMDVHDEIDADPRETCVKLIRYLLENQVDGCIDWGHIDFQ